MPKSKVSYGAFLSSWKQSDVLYGIEVERAKVLKMLVLPGTPGQDAPERRPVYTQDDLSDAVWSYGEPYRTDAELERRLKSPKRGIAFRDFLENHDKYNVVERLDELVEQEMRLETLGRLDKAGVEFHIRRGATVHFVFGDQLKSIKEMANKQGPVGKSRIARTVRWIYRHRDNIHVIRGVRFWNTKGLVPLHVVFWDTSWASYQSKRVYVGSAWDSGEARQSPFKSASVAPPPWTAPPPPRTASPPPPTAVPKWWEPNNSWTERGRARNRGHEKGVNRYLARAIGGAFATADDAFYDAMADGLHDSAFNDEMRRISERAADTSNARANLTRIGNEDARRRATLKVIKGICKGWDPVTADEVALTKQKFLQAFPELGDFGWEEVDGVDVD